MEKIIKRKRKFQTVKIVKLILLEYMEAGHIKKLLVGV